MVVGVGIVVLVFLLFTKFIDGEKHTHLRNFLIILVFPFLFLIPASLTLDQTVCEVVVVNETTVGNTTTYEHDDHCYYKANGSSGFLKAYVTILIVFMTYVLIMFGADIIKGFRNLVRKS